LLSHLENGVLRRLLEGWEFSWNLQMTSGLPSQIFNGTTNGFFGMTGTNHLFNNAYLLDVCQGQAYCLPNATQEVPGKGNLQFAYGSQVGYFYPGPGGNASKYTVGPDPQCYDAGIVGTASQANCRTGGNSSTVNGPVLSALYLTAYDQTTHQPIAFDTASTTLPAAYSGRAILVNPQPGRQGTFNRFVEGIGDFSLDMGLIKNLMVVEGKSIQIRVQATNILNHPSPCGYQWGGGQNACPALGLQTSQNLMGGNGATQAFGTVNKQYYTGNMWGFGMNRQFQANVRLLF